MNTPLQKAAQAVINRWDSPSWKDQPHTGEYIAELRKALDDELVQSVEPYGWMVSGTPTVMRGSMAQAIQEQEAKHIGGTCKAYPVYTSPQQAKRVPMTDMEIYTALASTVENPELAEELIGCEEWSEIVDMIRRIESHHGITEPSEKPTDWSAA